MKRKVIQLIVNSDSDHAQGDFIALCDDGSIWDRRYRCASQEEAPRFVWAPIDGPPEQIE
jgi:hypothetical protein